MWVWVPLRQRAGGGGSRVPEAQITTENGQTALRQDKEAAGFPPTPAPSLAPSMGHTERQCVLKWICWAAQGCAQRAP